MATNLDSQNLFLSMFFLFAHACIYQGMTGSDCPFPPKPNLRSECGCSGLEPRAKKSRQLLVTATGGTQADDTCLVFAFSPHTPPAKVLETPRHASVDKTPRIVCTVMRSRTAPLDARASATNTVAASAALGAGSTGRDAITGRARPDVPCTRASRPRDVSIFEYFNHGRRHHVLMLSLKTAACVAPRIDGPKQLQDSLEPNTGEVSIPSAAKTLWRGQPPSRGNGISS